MQKLLSVVAAAGLGLATAGCAWFPFFGGGGGGMDMAKTMADQPDYKIAVPIAGASVGTWASWDDGAGNVNAWWGVTGEKDGNWVIENRIPSGKYTMIYVVDSDGNKVESWVANWDPEGKELQEAKKRELKDLPDHPAATDAPQPETGDEDVNAAGKDWPCKWTKSGDSKMWMCDDLPFTKCVKMEYGGKVMSMLKEMGTDATMGFKWPEAKS